MPPTAGHSHSQNKLPRCRIPRFLLLSPQRHEPALTPNLDSALAHAAGVIAGLRRERPVAPARFLVPTNRAIRYVQSQLGDNLNLHVTPFLPLARAILSAAGSPADPLDDASRRHLLRHLLADLQAEGALTSFSPVHEKPGFVAALIDWLGEMKSQGIRPDQVTAEAGRTGLARDMQLAALFSRYQAFLQTNNVADDDGLLWLAADALAADSELFAAEAPLFVLGFDQFNPTQRRLLAGLANRLPALNLYLLWDDSRPAGDLVLTRLAETRAELETELGLQAVPLPAESASDNPDLHHLRTYLLREAEEKAPAPAGLRAIAAASREDEVRWLLRDLKGRLLAGADPAEIAVLAPQPSLYRRLLSTAGTEYGVRFPLQEPLKLNPAAAAFLNLIALAPDFPWRLTLETLRSPYIAQPWLDAAQLGLLEALTRERPVVAGREQWRFALRPLTLDEPDREDEDLGPRPLVARLAPEELAAIESGLLAFFDLVTPPDKATPRAFVQWLENNLLFTAESGHSLALLDCAANETRTVERDQAALQVLLTQLRRLLAATDLTNGDSPISWDKFRGYLTELIPEATGAPPELDNGLFFGGLEEGRALQLDHLYILGLSEGEFPRPASPDIFYDPQERANHPLPLVRAQPAESATLWWQLLACPRAELTLLRPRFDESGALWVPSPYWDASVSLFPDFAPEELALAPAPALERVASPTEVLNSAAAMGAAAVPATISEPWAAAARALALETQRQSWAPPGAAEGILAAADIIADLATRFGENHHWSASRLNRYGLCPYGFFAEHILKLSELADPTEGFDAMQRGSLLHAILEELFRRLTAAGRRPEPESETWLQTELEAVCQQLFADAPRRYGFRESALWRYEQAELRRLLRLLVAWECENGGAAPREPLYQELRFGFADTELPPLSLDVDGVRFQLHGVIDRIDRDEAGDPHIIDYKSGRTAYSSKDVAEGRSLQVVLYRRAVEALLPAAGTVATSYYLHLPTRETSGQPRANQVEERNDEALASAAYFVHAARSGLFPSAPSKPDGQTACRANCSLAPLCRVTRESIAKWRRQN